MSRPLPEGGPTAGRAASSEPTMLKALLREKNLQNYGLFKRAYEKAAAELDRSLVGTHPSEKTFHRWMSGRVKDLPRAEHCVVLEAMLPGWSAADLFKPYVPPSDVDGSTLLKELLRRRRLQTYRAFCKAYDTAAALIDKKLVGSFPAERQFYRWISGDMIGLPYSDHCNVLEKCSPDTPRGNSLTSTTMSASSARLTIPVARRRKVLICLSCGGFMKQKSCRFLATNSVRWITVGESLFRPGLPREGLFS